MTCNRILIYFENLIKLGNFWAIGQPILNFKKSFSKWEANRKQEKSVFGSGALTLARSPISSHTTVCTFSRLYNQLTAANAISADQSQSFYPTKWIAIYWNSPRECRSARALHVMACRSRLEKHFQIGRLMIRPSKDPFIEQCGDVHTWQVHKIRGAN